MLLDIGVGILLGLWLGPSTSATINVLLGISFVLLPDLDTPIYFAIRRTKVGSKLRDHRELFHYPLIFIGVGVVLMALVSPRLVPLFVAGSLAQYAHDSFGTGWGIPWLYPLSNKYFKFLYQYDLHKAGQPQKLMWVWSKPEQNQLIDAYGDKEWHKHTFQIFKHAKAWHLFEIAVFVIALVVLIVR